MRNPFGTLHRETILKNGGGSQFAAKAETQKTMRIRKQEPHTCNDEWDKLRLYDTLTCLIPRDMHNLITHSRAQNIARTGNSFLVVRSDGYFYSLFKAQRVDAPAVLPMHSQSGPL